ncbi:MULTISPECIES: aspartyl-phosphate phosphatase Spo0E family protein [Neobacillus]|jgi:hypothetical protein|uniref:aspartyl-phosphate phosphatase Spo0E family protein n=1 Tax=Neobacillus TaxID=2675232 RepID=UPI0027DF802E|nr:aspartyl-phosphate phosphatase Spo0E family protein [Neobacillus sp. PS2-9]WML56475.1 aspartyl-phosphate phosphatase Spo0E family protein [Neobacillus sp. PS2-9]
MLPIPTLDIKIPLLLEIKSLQKEMIEIGYKEGFASQKTLEISQKLDQYILTYQKMKH